jgi:hypothetical protein
MDDTVSFLFFSFLCLLGFVSRYLLFSFVLEPSGERSSEKGGICNGRVLTLTRVMGHDPC